MSVASVALALSFPLCACITTSKVGMCCVRACRLVVFQSSLPPSMKTCLGRHGGQELSGHGGEHDARREVLHHRHERLLMGVWWGLKACAM
jgi:hypothetical protein